MHISIKFINGYITTIQNVVLGRFPDRKIEGKKERRTATGFQL